MLNNFTKRIEKWGTIQFIFLFTGLAELFTAFMNAVLSIIFWDKISFDLLAIGSIDALLVSLVVSSIGIYLIRKNSELHNEISASKRTENLLRQEHDLYLDLVNNQPAGIYRIRVYPREQWQKDAWINPEHPPYSVDLASNRFCEILGISRQVFEANPGIVEDLIYPEDKEDFRSRNEEANAEMVIFQWEGRLFIRGEILWVHLESIPRLIENGVVLWTGILYNITDRKRAEMEREAALARIKKLEGVIPICMHCKKIRDDKNSWNQLEQYITEHSEALFSHGQCPECAENAMKEFEEFKKGHNK